MDDCQLEQFASQGRILEMNENLFPVNMIYNIISGIKILYNAVIIMFWNFSKNDRLIVVLWYFLFDTFYSIYRCFYYMLLWGEYTFKTKTISLFCVIINIFYVFIYTLHTLCTVLRANLQKQPCCGIHFLRLHLKIFLFAVQGLYQENRVGR